jgi:hypothetical protein
MQAVVSTSTDLEVSTFNYIIRKVQDITTVIDSTISISTGVGIADKGFKGTRLSFDLKRGRAEIMFAQVSSRIVYTSQNGGQREAVFLHSNGVAQEKVERAFDVALREIILADREYIAADIEQIVETEDSDS